MSDFYRVDRTRANPPLTMHPDEVWVPDLGGVLVPIDLEASSGEVFGGFAEDAAGRHLSELGNPDGFGAWYWEYFVWYPATHITRGYGDSMERMEWHDDA